MKPRPVTQTSTVYMQTCSVCHNEFSVSEDSQNTTCYDCKTHAAYDRALNEGSFLIGAELIAFEPKPTGHYTNYSELSSIKVKTKDGRIIQFEADGWDERYISLEELSQP